MTGSSPVMTRQGFLAQLTNVIPGSIGDLLSDPLAAGQEFYLVTLCK
jgi:hypothetical protein